VRKLAAYTKREVSKPLRKINSMPIDGIGRPTLIVLESIADGKAVDYGDG